jgi:hypothetical protein
VCLKKANTPTSILTSASLLRRRLAQNIGLSLNPLKIGVKIIGKTRVKQ